MVELGRQDEERYVTLPELGKKLFVANEPFGKSLAKPDMKANNSSM